MPSDTSAVDAAVIAKLLTDSTLMAITTDGVYWDVAPQGAERFVIVSQPTHRDENMQTNASAFEVVTYLVKAVITSTSGANVATAAARIHTLLQAGSLSITGYTLMSLARTERIAYAETDPANQDRRWQHRGGLYEAWVSPS